MIWLNQKKWTINKTETDQAGGPLESSKRRWKRHADWKYEADRKIDTEIEREREQRWRGGGSSPGGGASSAVAAAAAAASAAVDAAVQAEEVSNKKESKENDGALTGKFRFTCKNINTNKKKKEEEIINQSINNK